jgi:hypothetical protein
MLVITIVEDELFNNETQEFIPINSVTLELEHSLLSVSKWESKYQKPFLAAGEKSVDEIFDYIKLMVITKDVPPEVFGRFSSQNLDAVNAYIESKQSATTFGEMPKKPGRSETITSELIYYWMVMFNIPFECETWHLNRLFSLIRICNVKNSKPKKMSRSEMIQQRNELNARRKAEMGTSG